MAYKKGDKVFVPFCPAEPELGYWHTLTKKEADAKNHMSELFDKWAKELDELIKGDKQNGKR